MKAPIIGIYGKSNTGKTTLIVNIIDQLSNDGLNIASIKITDKKIGIDTKGKDTDKYGESGANLVVLSSQIETDFLLKKPKDVSDIIFLINQIDKYNLIIIEGANDKYTPKIRIGDIKKRDNTIFTYSGDVNEVVDFIKNRIIGGKNDNKS